MLNFTSSFTHHHHLLGISQARAAGKEIGDLMTSFQHFEGLDEEEEDLNNSSNNNKNKKRRKVYIYTSPYRRTKQTLFHMLQEIEGIDFCESNDENEEEEEEKEGDYERLKKSERKSDTSCIEVLLLREKIKFIPYHHIFFHSFPIFLCNQLDFGSEGRTKVNYFLKWMELILYVIKIIRLTEQQFGNLQTNEVRSSKKF